MDVVEYGHVMRLSAFYFFGKFFSFFKWIKSVLDLPEVRIARTHTYLSFGFNLYSCILSHTSPDAA